MTNFTVLFLFLANFLFICDSARILAVFPAPYPSHQSVFRPLTIELARRGHQVVVITTNPLFNGNFPQNYTEIDVHDVSYKIRDNTEVRVTGNSDDIFDQADKLFDMLGKLFEVQVRTAGVQKLISDKKQRFDLLLIEACARPALVFSHFFKAPVITISSLGSLEIFTQYLGATTHPILYPNSWRQRLKNMSFFEKVNELYKHYYIKSIIETKEENENDLLRTLFGDDVPPLNELKKNVALLMLNVHHIWEDNRPVPPNIVYLGGLHLHIGDTQKMSPHLQSYLDSSVHGVIYMSLGSLVIPSKLIDLTIVIKALGKVPYDILLKWDQDELPECPRNVKIVKWTPQREVLGHPNTKLFISQGGLQSTDEAIVAGVPLIGLPILGDQWYNVEKYVDLNIGVRVDLETVTEQKMQDAVNTVISDSSYKRNIIALRDYLYDRPENSLDRAVWWVEHVLRHGKSTFFQAPSAHMGTWEYFEIDFVLCLLSISVVILSVALFVVWKCFNFKNGTKIKCN